VTPAELEADPRLDDARGQQRSEKLAIVRAAGSQEIDEPAVGIEETLPEVIEERRLAEREYLRR
jgi:hypothetical protein